MGVNFDKNDLIKMIKQAGGNTGSIENRDKDTLLRKLVSAMSDVTPDKVFVEDGVETVIFEEQTVALSPSFGLNVGNVVFNQEIIFDKHVLFEVTYNGTPYRCMIRHYGEYAAFGDIIGNGSIYNSAFCPNTHEPFMFAINSADKTRAILIVSENVSECTIAVKAVNFDVRKLSYEATPNGYPQKDDSETYCMMDLGVYENEENVYFNYQTLVNGSYTVWFNGEKFNFDSANERKDDEDFDVWTLGNESLSSWLPGGTDTGEDFCVLLYDDATGYIFLKDESAEMCIAVKHPAKITKMALEFMPDAFTNLINLLVQKNVITAQDRSNILM